MGIHRYDLMHVLFLGVCQHLVGSILVELCDRGFWAGNGLKNKLKRAWRDLMVVRECDASSSAYQLPRVGSRVTSLEGYPHRSTATSG